MPVFLATRDNLKSIKDQIRSLFELPSGHLSEALAAALGSNTYAALLAKIDDAKGVELRLHMSDAAFVKRLSEFGHVINKSRGWMGFSSFQSSAVLLEEGESYRRVELGTKFCVVWNLVIMPDFSRVESGKDTPPWINHNKIDFEKLRSAIAQEFVYGSPVNIRIGNDTIDQTVVHFRQMGILNGPIDCSDFCEVLLKKSKEQSGGVIDVRGSWENLQYMKDRAMAPPPVMLPIVVEAEDAEDAILWGQQVQMLMGVKNADPHRIFGMEPQGGPEDGLGSLPTRLGKLFFEQFKIRYMKNVLITIGATDPKPIWMRR